MWECFNLIANLKWLIRYNINMYMLLLFMSSSGELRDPLRCTRGMPSSGLTDLSVNVTANIHNYAKFKAICKGNWCKDFYLPSSDSQQQSAQGTLYCTDQIHRIIQRNPLTFFKQLAILRRKKSVLIALSSPQVSSFK